MTEYFRDIAPSHWLCVVRQNGTLEVYSMDASVRQGFQAPHVHLGHRLLVNVKADDPVVHPSALPCSIVEVCLVGLGHLHRRPLLVLRTSDFGILLYEAIPAYLGLDPEQLKIRFRKLNHSMILRETKTFVRKGAGQANASESSTWSRNQLKYFANIAGYSGVNNKINLWLIY